MLVRLLICYFAYRGFLFILRYILAQIFNTFFLPQLIAEKKNRLLIVVGYGLGYFLEFLGKISRYTDLFSSVRKRINVMQKQNEENTIKKNPKKYFMQRCSQFVKFLIKYELINKNALFDFDKHTGDLWNQWVDVDKFKPEELASSPYLLSQLMIFIDDKLSRRSKWRIYDSRPQKGFWYLGDHTLFNSAYSFYALNNILPENKQMWGEEIKLTDGTIREIKWRVGIGKQIFVVTSQDFTTYGFADLINMLFAKADINSYLVSMATGGDNVAVFILPKDKVEQFIKEAEVMKISNFYMSKPSKEITIEEDKDTKRELFSSKLITKTTLDFLAQTTIIAPKTFKNWLSRSQVDDDLISFFSNYCLGRRKMMGRNVPLANWDFIMFIHQHHDSLIKNKLLVVATAVNGDYYAINYQEVRYPVYIVDHDSVDPIVRRIKVTEDLESFYKKAIINQLPYDFQNAKEKGGVVIE